MPERPTDPAAEADPHRRSVRSRFYFWLLVGLMVLIAAAGAVRLATLPR